MRTSNGSWSPKQPGTSIRYAVYYLSIHLFVIHSSITICSFSSFIHSFIRFMWSFIHHYFGAREYREEDFDRVLVPQGADVAPVQWQVVLFYERDGWVFVMSEVHL